MNFTDLKYVIEIDKCGSISLAAKNLYVAQSNLSRAVKELEHEFDIVIFRRTPKGVITTREGQRFLRHAKEIQYQINNLTNAYSDVNDHGVNLKISVPRASYISEVFTNFLDTLDEEENMRIHYCETNSSKTIQNVLDFHYDIGIIRYNVMHEGYYLSLFKLKDLSYRLILEFDYLLLTSKDSIIADKHIRADSDLDGCIEVVHGDERLPTGGYIDLTENDREERCQKKVIYLYERASQFEILSTVPNTYMWVSPVPDETLEKYGLIQKRCGSYAKYMKDVLVFKENHVPKKYEKQLVDKLREKTREFGCYL
ncbi:LysR family transcriptional regulator [Anaerotignum sp.]|uniref:LysR family transcriptional regulator n=1 Tax=Anaerotignum sp. TaxID=2039241 RepID=UPI002899E424|nr:LysR family transcriptional regulator [Anaerotignum sp.]